MSPDQKRFEEIFVRCFTTPDRAEADALVTEIGTIIGRVFRERDQLKAQQEWMLQTTIEAGPEALDQILRSARRGT